MRSASVVIPTFNRAHLIHRAIESAINQTYPCEVILCDHGSTDKTPEIAANYKTRIRYIRREEDRGPIICWRDAIENASGEIVHITYDDDWIEPMFMEKTISILYDDVGFVYTDIACYDLNEHKNSYSYRHPPGINPMKDIVRHLLLTDITISPGCAIFRKKDLQMNLLSEIPDSKGRYGKNTGVGEDLLLFLLTSLDYSKSGYIQEPLACFLHHPSSITMDAVQSGKFKDLTNAYDTAKQYYFNLPGSISRMSRLQRLLFLIKWHYKAGILKETVVSTLKRKLTFAYCFIRKLK